MSSQLQELQHSTAIGELLHRLCVRFHFASVKSVRNTMAQSGAIISGSVALAVLQPQMQEPSDIDFYVPPRGLARLLKFILSHGYDLTVPAPGEGDYQAFTDRAPGEGKYPPRIVLKLVHPASGSRVDIVVPLAAKSVVEEVTKFHSTVVMNYVTHYGVVSLYPSWTMCGVGAVVREGAEERCIQKYRDRGYTMVNDPSLLPMGGEGQCLGPQAKRSTFDDETLLIPFDDYAPTANLSAFEARETSWTLG
jgi:hypothetical protein